MTEVKEYRGHIRNWRDLCKELNITEYDGRDDREMPEKISQSVQIDKEMALELIKLLNDAFK